MENKEFLEKLKFGIGDGNLQYYLYNWKCPYMEPTKVSYSAMTLLRLIFLDPCLIRRKKRKHLSATPVRLTMKIIFARYMDPIFRSQRNFLWIPLDTFDGLKTRTTWLKLLIIFLLRYLYS